MWFQKNNRKIIVSALIIAVLAVAFIYGGNMPKRNGALTADTPVSTVQPTAAPAEGKDTPPAAPQPQETALLEAQLRETAIPVQVPAEDPAEEAEDPAAETEMTETGTDRYLTDPVPEGRPEPVEPQDAEMGETEFTCTISISCATILNNMELCDPDKREQVPADGWILLPSEVVFYEGESVFNVLQRVCKQNKIHMEFENTPLYNSAYIEGIHNLYEFDVGELSGWMYMVNDWFPNYGCSRYQLSDDDVIRWVYTCDLGYDVGGGYAIGEGGE